MFYDPTGKLIRKITPNLREKGQSIRYVYYYNRLIKIHYPNMPDVTYTYGNPGDSWNRAGRVTIVDNKNMKEEFFYGQLGETLKSIRSIKTSRGEKTFRTNFEWDNLGKMRKLIYPDGEVLKYKYNSGGQLKNVEGWYNGKMNVYVKEILYDEFGQKKKVTLGNDVVTEYEYNPENRRLTNLSTKGPGDKVFQNITYKFDNVGNIKERKNKDFKTNGDTKKTSIQTYKYDSLHRIKESGGTYNHESWIPIFNKRVNSYSNNFTYDSIGNFNTKTQLNTGVITNEDGSTETVTINKTSYDYTYKYDSFRPHAVTAAGPKTFTYDANGNMTRMQNSDTGLDRNLEWDDENRLIRSHDVFSGEISLENPGETTEESPGTITSFTYDSGGNRIVKNGKFGEVVYVNNNYTIRNEAVVGKHVFAGSMRVASKLGMIDSAEINNAGVTDNTGENNEPEIPLVDEGVFYYHGDHLGSSSVVTNMNGQFHEHIEYFPYGETWVHEKASDDAQSMRYKFTGKEQDPETGLYYYGARYYDPVISRWISVDAFAMYGKYLPNSGSGSNLPGMGGVFNPVNLNSYHFSGNNPVNYTDPDGNCIIRATVGLIRSAFRAGRNAMMAMRNRFASMRGRIRARNQRQRARINHNTVAGRLGAAGGPMALDAYTNVLLSGNVNILGFRIPANRREAVRLGTFLTGLAPGHNLGNGARYYVGRGIGARGMQNAAAGNIGAAVANWVMEAPLQNSMELADRGLAVINVNFPQFRRNARGFLRNHGATIAGIGLTAMIVSYNISNGNIQSAASALWSGFSGAASSLVNQAWSVPYY
jgi:RHS repeat-associated protein